jgi:hypothetical protein
MTTARTTAGTFIHFPQQFTLDGDGRLMAPPLPDLECIAGQLQDDALVPFAAQLLRHARRRRSKARHARLNLARLELARLCLVRAANHAGLAT